MQCQRDLYTLPDDVRYLNNAFLSPLTKRVQQAGRDAIARQANPSVLTAGDFFDPADGLRRTFASLIGTDDWEAVAFIPAASYGLSTIAANVALKPHENLVVLGEQFPSNVYAWRRLCRKHGATLRTVAPPQGATDRGAAWNESLIEAVDDKTALVSIANVHWSDGTLFNLEAVGDACRKHGSMFVVDGTQSVGAIPMDVNHLGLDALICAGYKALTGPYGLGLAYYGARFREAVPIEENWISRAGSEVFSRLVDYVDEYQPGSKRLDSGGYSSFTLLPMLTAAVEQVIEWKPENIQAYCRGLTTRLAAAATALGYRVEDEAYRAYHIMGIRMPSGIDTEHMKKRLEERNIFVSVRGQALRVAPHVYSRESDVDALIEVLRASRD